ncbi:MAG: carbohydrate binding domain-containing protein [Verrucomicrobiota bacterium]
MKTFLKALPLFACLCVPYVQAADAGKGKVIDAFNTLDAKTVKVQDLKAKIVSSPDPAHNKALEMVIDFAKPGSYPRVIKSIPPGTIDPKKYSGVRFSFKSDTETKMAISLRVGVVGPDGRNPAYAVNVEGKPTWNEITIPFDKFKSFEQKTWKDGAQKVFPGGESIRPEEFAQIKEIHMVFSIENRGNAATSQFLVDGLELVPNP